MTDEDARTTECWRCGEQRYTHESCHHCGGSCKPMTKKQQQREGRDEGDDPLVKVSWRRMCSYCGSIEDSRETSLTEGVDYGISISQCENCEELTPQMVTVVIEEVWHL